MGVLVVYCDTSSVDCYSGVVVPYLCLLGDIVGCLWGAGGLTCGIGIRRYVYISNTFSLPYTFLVELLSGYYGS